MITMMMAIMMTIKTITTAIIATPPPPPEPPPSPDESGKAMYNNAMCTHIINRISKLDTKDAAYL